MSSAYMNLALPIPASARVAKAVRTSSRLHNVVPRAFGKSASTRALKGRLFVTASTSTVENQTKVDEAFEMMSMWGPSMWGTPGISRDELIAALRDTTLTEKGIMEVLSIMDEDNSGLIDKEEFQAFFDRAPDAGDFNWTSTGTEESQKAYMEVLNGVFPGSASQTDFVASMTNILGGRGFTRDNSIQMISLCRDEITRDLIEQLDGLWGQSFNISSLAGLIFCGCTSFKAAMSHAPEVLPGTNEKFVFTVAPHIAIDEKGNIGAVKRVGIAATSSACGALIAFTNEAKGGKCSFGVDMTDVEMSLLRQSLASNMNLASMSGTNLETVTKTAAKVIQKQLEETLAIVIPPGSNKDYAVCVGVQIHGPANKGYFQCVDMYDVTNDEKTDLMPVYRDVLESRQQKSGSFIWAQNQISKFANEQLLASAQKVIANNELSRLQFLVEKGLPLRAKNKATGASLMHLACSSGALPIVKFLALKDSKLKDTTDIEGATPLQVAIENDHDDIVEFLLSIGSRYVSMKVKR
ncbi:hypothetical protein CYMTET_37693 [Cymbomonas tetramitiformis]|uniref:EF-hand domain-containing protein n=1 Tax=Cymbomonas tetramitiformis TaxID=36881 RepID=A0AAE0CER7_9CHLO|nr:hypothetical protein CYMTET_37693 [Cymbomonas tetramitiformis]